jgi:hypothetical protein
MSRASASAIIASVRSGTGVGAFQSIPRAGSTKESLIGVVICCRGQRLNRGSAELQLHLIHKAPSPVLSRLDRAHDRMAAGMKMLGGVLVLRGVATADVSALQAQTQVDPRVASLQTLLAAAGVRLHVFHVLQMLATCRRLCHDIPPYFCAKYRCTNVTAMAPSPTAAAQRLTEP